MAEASKGKSNRSVLATLQDFVDLSFRLDGIVRACVDMCGYVWISLSYRRSKPSIPGATLRLESSRQGY